MQCSARRQGKTGGVEGEEGWCKTAAIAESTHRVFSLGVILHRDFIYTYHLLLHTYHLLLPIVHLAENAEGDAMQAAAYK